MKSTINKLLVAMSIAALSSLCSTLAQAATPYVSTTIEGALAPGVYGRIDIGNAPPPPLIYAQPVVIYRTPVVVQQQPLYLHVPPGHAKNWSKHCARYNACGQPVYFVRVNGDDDYEQVKAKEYKDKNDKKDKHHGNGNGNGKGDHDD